MYLWSELREISKEVASLPKVHRLRGKHVAAAAIGRLPVMLHQLFYAVGRADSLWSKDIIGARVKAVSYQHVESSLVSATTVEFIS